MPATATGESADATRPRERQGTCSCGSGMPVTTLVVDGKAVEMVVLPLIFKKFAEAGCQPDAIVAQQLLDQAKIYNSIPTEAEECYRQAILLEYIKFSDQEAKP
jgi:hypothetical protein